MQAAEDAAFVFQRNDGQGFQTFPQACFPDVKGEFSKFALPIPFQDMKPGWESGGYDFSNKSSFTPLQADHVHVPGGVID